MGDNDDAAGMAGPTDTGDDEPAESHQRAGWSDADMAGLASPSEDAGSASESARAESNPYDGDGDDAASPPVVATFDAEVGSALADGAVVAVPAVGGYCLAVRVGTPGAEARLEALVADPDGPHYAVGHRDDVRALTSGWSDEVERLLERCWPGPVDVFLPRANEASAAARSDSDVNGEGDDDATDERGDESVGEDAFADQGEVRTPGGDDRGGWAVTVGMPDGRALRRLCKEHGPWRTIPLNFNEASEVAHAFDATDVALVVDGGRRDGQLPTLVDATVTPVRVLREGALPSNFIDASMAMGARKRLFRRSRSREG